MTKIHNDCHNVTSVIQWPPSPPPPPHTHTPLHAGIIETKGSTTCLLFVHYFTMYKIPQKAYLQQSDANLFFTTTSPFCDRHYNDPYQFPLEDFCHVVSLPPTWKSFVYQRQTPLRTVSSLSPAVRLTRAAWAVTTALTFFICQSHLMLFVSFGQLWWRSVCGWESTAPKRYVH